MDNNIIIVGGGLSGCEAAWYLANKGHKVIIYEMRNESTKTFAHTTDCLSELVCSNSLRSDDEETAIGLLHKELRQLDSLIMESADKHKLPAGSALAVDRNIFSAYIQKKIIEHPNITLKREKFTQLPDKEDGNYYIIATGPLTSEELANDIMKKTGEENLAFFDAIAPTILTDSIDFSKAWFQSRYDKGGGKDYLNCPMNKEQYNLFIDAIIQGEKTEFKEWEKNTPYFEGCLPIEVMAERGRETLRFGPMKPVGLTNPHDTEKPYAVVQLRQDNKEATIYNIVGFQTKLKYGEQQKIFRMIPGLENAEFARYGGIHRNCFINSPRMLDSTLKLRAVPNVRFAGQVTGVEGYVESAACGLLAAMFLAGEIAGRKIVVPPQSTAIGSLLYHITVSADHSQFQPMNVNFGLFPALIGKIHKKDRKAEYKNRAISEFEAWRAVFS